MGNLKQSFLARGSKNPAIEPLKKQPVSQTDEKLSSAELEKYQNEPSIKAAEALGQLFRQAQGLPGLETPNSYTLAPAAPTYKPVVGGDPDAIQAYARLVCKHVENLNSLIGSHTKHLLPVSRTRFTWPILKSEHPVLSQDEDDILTMLEVGKETGRYFDRFSKWKPDGEIALLVDELLCWADYCKRESKRNKEPVIIVPRTIYDRFEDHPLIAKLRKHLEPCELEVARLKPLERNSVAEWVEFVRALLDDCFNDRHCAKFLASGFVFAESREQKHGFSRAKSYLVSKVLKRLKALAGDK